MDYICYCCNITFYYASIVGVTRDLIFFVSRPQSGMHDHGENDATFDVNGCTN